MKIPEEFWYGISSLPTTILLLVKRRKTPGCYDGRAESIVREIHGLCPRTSNHYGVPVQNSFKPGDRMMFEVMEE